MASPRTPPPAAAMPACAWPMRAVPWPGVRFDFGGGVVLLIPPLSCGALEVLQDRLAAMPGLTMTDPDAIATVVDAAHLALQRNYAGITRQEVAELVDIGNLGDVYECLMDVGGVRRRAQQDADRDPTRAAAAGSAGATSTPASQAAPAGQ